MPTLPLPLGPAAWLCARALLCALCRLFRNRLFFFFKQKTAYDITYGDWSSDVCSSDLEIRTHALLIPYPTSDDPPQRARSVARPERRRPRRRDPRNAGARAPLRRARLHALLAGRAPFHAGARRLGARGADRPGGGGDVGHSRRLGRRHAPALQRAESGRGVPRAGDAL